MTTRIPLTILALAALLMTACAFFVRSWIGQVGEKTAAAVGRKLFNLLISLPLDFFAGIPIKSRSNDACHAPALPRRKSALRADA